jgi:poly-beta-hydroxyalkanoate depolymerase
MRGRLRTSRHANSHRRWYKHFRQNNGDQTAGYEEQFDAGSASTTTFTYIIDGVDASFTQYNVVLDGGQANNTGQ